MHNFSDYELLIAENFEAAFTVLYNRYWEGLYKKALTKFGNDADAQDAVQEVFISLWKNRKTIDASNTIAPYLFVALKYCIIKKIYRKSKKGILVPLSIQLLEESVSSEENDFQVKELQSLILSELNHLPAKMRLVYDLSRVENLRTAEIAKKLNISEQTVKNTLTTALKRLRRRIAHYSHLLLSFTAIQFFYLLK